MDEFGVQIILSLGMGLLARIYMIRIDQRQYPSYPQGLISHLTLGVIAASLGAVALPALVQKEYSAVTFLALAAQQFRDVRNMERQSLDNIEGTELIPRGTAYIEDIAKAFEARNYMVIITSLMTSITFYFIKIIKLPIYLQIFFGIFIGSITAVALKKLLSRQLIVEIAQVMPAHIHFDGPLLMVNDVVIMNIGLKGSRKIYEERGIAVEIIPNDANARATLANMGQRQAVQHNAAIQLGIRKDVDEPDFTPIARRNPHNGNIVMAIIPMEPNMDLLVEAVNKTPVLETAKRKPLESKIGSKENNELKGEL
ncbi:YIEGIA family protein [Crassaminicella profunda]|uniref:YIEGIA family protein n=1 Tax=Crassaminicella profunda TaxID=1286698 RepID=UPI001CA7AF83|nr:YIEGIA family protein [Crassaminicella profunda]QZY57149.1 YIEGIA family protein [Crassaminicella profunda]